MKTSLMIEISFVLWLRRGTVPLLGIYPLFSVKINNSVTKQEKGIQH